MALQLTQKKTEVIYQPAPGKPYSEPTITVNGQTLQVVDQITYLGSALSRAVHTNDEATPDLQMWHLLDFMHMSESGMT